MTSECLLVTTQFTHLSDMTAITLRASQNLHQTTNTLSMYKASKMIRKVHIWLIYPESNHTENNHLTSMIGNNNHKYLVFSSGRNLWILGIQWDNKKHKRISSHLSNTNPSHFYLNFCYNIIKQTCLNLFSVDQIN